MDTTTQLVGFLKKEVLSKNVVGNDKEVRRRRQNNGNKIRTRTSIE